MRLILSPEASSDLDDIYEHISADHPLAAADQVSRVLDALELLLEQPNMGRPGEVAGTRELVVPETPYVAVYEVNGENIDVLRLWHGRQDWRH